MAVPVSGQTPLLHRKADGSFMPQVSSLVCEVWTRSGRWRAARCQTGEAEPPKPSPLAPQQRSQPLVPFLRGCLALDKGAKPAASCSVAEAWAGAAVPGRL